MEWYLKVVKDNYANFSGRARRKEFWMFNLINFLINVALILLAFYVPAIANIAIGIFVVYGLAVMVPSLAVTFRRLQDTGRKGLWILISLIPFVGALILIVFCVMDSQHGENQFGPNPKGIGNTSGIDSIGRS